MKKLLLGLLFIACIGVSYAQSNNPEAAIVKLKSGLEVRGVLLEHIENVSVTIKTAEGDIFVYRASEVAQIEKPNAVSTRVEKRQKEEQIKLEAKNAKLEAKNAKKEMREKRALGNFKGYRGIIDVSVGYEPQFGSADSADHYKWINGLQTKFSFINGYNAGPGFYIGIGVGFSIFKDFDFSDSEDFSQYGKSYSVPLFLHLRTSWAKNRKVSPFLSLSAGYSLDLTGLPICNTHGALPGSYYQYYSYGSDYNCLPENGCSYAHTKMNKFFVEPSFGLEFRTSRKTAITVAFTVPMHFAFGDLEYMSFPLGANIGFSF